MTTQNQSDIETKLASLSRLVDMLKSIALIKDFNARDNAIDICQEICDLSVEISAQLAIANN